MIVMGCTTKGGVKRIKILVLFAHRVSGPYVVTGDLRLSAARGTAPFVASKW